MRSPLLLLISRLKVKQTRREGCGDGVAQCRTSDYLARAAKSGDGDDERGFSRALFFRVAVAQPDTIGRQIKSARSAMGRRLERREREKTLSRVLSSLKVVSSKYSQVEAQNNTARRAGNDQSSPRQRLSSHELG